MRRSLLVGLAVVLGIAVTACNKTTPTAHNTDAAPTTTTTTTAPNGLPEGRYNLQLNNGDGGSLFLDVIDRSGHQVTINVTSVGVDGTQDPVAQMQGTAIDGTLTLTTNVCNPCDPPTVSASYGSGGNLPGRKPTGLVSIYFGAANNGCKMWGSGPSTMTMADGSTESFWPAEDCNFVYSPTGS